MLLVLVVLVLGEERNSGDGFRLKYRWSVSITCDNF